MKLKTSVFLITMILSAVPAFAGWQNYGYYIDDGYYVDDGSRFVLGVRGGLSLANAKMKNEIGTLEADYWVNEDTGSIITGLAYENLGSPTGYTDIGVGDIATLSVIKNFSKMSFTAGASIGFTIPYHSQWRLEAGFDHIAETDYNQTPFLEGDLEFSSDYSGHVFSSGVTSTVTTDIFSAMAFYDFFEGDVKQVNVLIPYVGFGIGYSSSKTTLKLTDIYGDLSRDSDLANYGSADDNGVIQFANPVSSESPTSSNIAFLGSVGASYGISQFTFLDFNFRLMYVPKVTWQLVNGSLHRDWFAADNMIYTNFMVGLRFEF